MELRYNLKMKLIKYTKTDNKTFFKVIKYYGWEISFLKMINNIRSLELKVLKKCTFFYYLFNFNFSFTTFAVTLFGKKLFCI